jgi:hypothetical protein
METGAGDSQLLNDLLAPETASGNPEDVEPIVNEVETPKQEANDGAKKGKDIIPPKSVDGKTDEEKQTGESLIADFLSDVEEEEEVEEKKEPEATEAEAEAEEETDDVENEDPKEGTQFSALAGDLFDLGVFTKNSEDEEISINTAEEFLDRFTAEKKKGASELVQNFIGQFGEDYQNAFESIFVKGVDPKEYFGTYNQIVNFTEMDLSKENNQKSVMRQALSGQGFETEDIGKEIERLENYGDLESVATRHHKVLVKKEAVKLQKLDKEAQDVQEQKVAIRNQYVQNVQTILTDKLKEKEFDGIPINNNLANELPMGSLVVRLLNCY